LPAGANTVRGGSFGGGERPIRDNDPFHGARRVMVSDHAEIPPRDQISRNAGNARRHLQPGAHRRRSRRRSTAAKRHKPR
jgi:hypothetical protein